MAEEKKVSMCLSPEYHRRADIENFIKEELLNEERNAFLNTQQFQVWGKDKLKGDGYDHFGKVKYFKDDLLAELTGLDFVFILNVEIWDAASDNIRRAIISHFLYRIEPMLEYVDDDGRKVKCVHRDLPEEYIGNYTYQVGKTGRLKFKIVKPFGEFPEVIKKFGDWNMDVRELKNSFKTK